jgi:hypothetical protein
VRRPVTRGRSCRRPPARAARWTTASSSPCSASSQPYPTLGSLLPPPPREGATSTPQPAGTIPAPAAEDRRARAGRRSPPAQRSSARRRNRRSYIRPDRRNKRLRRSIASWHRTSRATRPRTVSRLSGIARAWSPRRPAGKRRLRSGRGRAGEGTTVLVFACSSEAPSNQETCAPGRAAHGEAAISSFDDPGCFDEGARMNPVTAVPSASAPAPPSPRKRARPRFLRALSSSGAYPGAQYVSASTVY